MSDHAGIFPTFFLSGFECSTFIWKDQGRRDLVEETQHRAHVQDDYGILRKLGIAVAREGIPWPMVDRGGTYDFSCIDPFIAAMNAPKKGSSSERSHAKRDRKSTRLNSSHANISYAVFCLKKKNT